MGFFSSFVVIEFLIVACFYCRDRPYLCRDIVSLSYTARTELCVAIDSEDVVTYLLL